VVSRKIFWDVDTQHDFMKADGKLYVPESESIIPNLARLRTFASTKGIRTVASADDHTLDDVELSAEPDFKNTFPPHCLRGTPGQHRIPETALNDPLVIDPSPQSASEVRRRVREHGGDVLFPKHRFDVFSNQNVDAALDEIDPDEIVVFGVALDVCVKHAVEGLLERRPDTRLVLVRDAVKAIDPAEGDRLIRDWVGRGVTLASTAEVVGAAERAEVEPIR
jgi:nicotinamidase/pyrazinamidase